MNSHLSCLLIPESPSAPQNLPVKGNSGPVVVAYAPGRTLAQAIYLSGVFAPPALCSGIGRCGRCRMRLNPAPPPCPEDETLFSPEELARGWRLGCRHLPRPGLAVELPEGSRLLPCARSGLAGIAPRVSSADPAPPLHPEQGPFLAVDLGTTSLQWMVTDADGALQSHGGMVNPQMGAGSDVISRLATASTPQGAERLQRLVLDALDGIASGAVPCQMEPSSASAGATPASAICLAANPAMTCIALGLPTRTLASAPYSLPCRGGEWKRLPGLPPAWIPPQISPFVGGDITAGYAALAFRSLANETPPVAWMPSRTSPQVPGASAGDAPFPFLLADLGTNGEFLLAVSPSEAVTASVALGPALEGIGLRFGTEARPGAVTGFSFSPGGLVMRFYAHGEHGGGASPPAQPAGITGTGYLSLLRHLLAVGAVSREGHFTPDRTPLTSRLFSASVDGCLPLPGGMFLSAADVEEILKVKAAFSAGLQCLLPAAGVASHELQAVYLAGALGSHVDTEALELLGFFPQGLRILPAGNTALAGAGLLLRSETLRRALVRWARNARSLDLASDSAFLRAFPANMRFSW